MRESSFKYHSILAAACDFQHCGILTSVDSDEFVHLPFKLKTPKDVQSVDLLS